MMFAQQNQSVALPPATGIGLSATLAGEAFYVGGHEAAWEAAQEAFEQQLAEALAEAETETEIEAAA